MRESAKYKSTNAYVISVQLNEETLTKLDRICAESGLSRSRIIKTLISTVEVRGTVTLTQADQSSTKKPISNNQKRKDTR